MFFQEEIGQSPKTEASRLCAFLGVSTLENSEFYERRANENVVYKNKAIELVYSRLGTAVRAAGLRNAVRWAKKTRGVSVVWSAAKENVRARVPPMRPETVDRLREELAPEMAALASLLGRDTLPWPSWRAVAEEAA